MNTVEDSLKERYRHIHPLIFARSVEKAKSDGELFDILDSIPEEYPVIWDDVSRRWIHTSDVLQAKINVVHE